MFILLSSCREELFVADKDLYHTWEATAFISVESMTYPKDENKSILLTFNRDGSYALKLEVNSCSSHFKSERKESIKMESPACTEMCCDSPFSNKLASMLPKVTSYRVEGKNLYLSVPGWGDIKLEKKE